MKLVVGLGNPGEKFARNRHNVGFLALEAIVRAHGFSPWRRRFQGASADGEIGGIRCVALKPETFMNESGRAVGEAARFLKIEASDVIVFHDELDLTPGKMKVKTGGGNAGHNGLKSISAHLGNEYVRARIGIGHPGSKDLVHNYVLHDFSKSDGAWLEPLLDAIAAAMPHLAHNDPGRFLGEIARATANDEARCPPPSEALSAREDKKPIEKPTLPAPASPDTALSAKLKGWLKRSTS